MSKKLKAIQTLAISAKVYDKKLKNKTFLFISYSNKFNSYKYYCIEFNGSNFKHLTGVETKMQAKVFYKKCLKNRLTISDFDLKQNGTTMLKLQLLPDMFDLENYKQIGVFDNSQFYRITAEIAAGNKTGVLALKDIGNNTYIPKSLLAEDIDNILTDFSKQDIICIYEKDRKEKCFNKIIWKNKNYNYKYLTDEIKNLIC